MAKRAVACGPRIENFRRRKHSPISKLDERRSETVSHGKSRKKSQSIFSLILAASAMISGFAVSALTSSPETPDSQNPLDVRAFYTPHSTISVNGDAALIAKASSEGWSGDGSSASPYVIAGYDIDGSTFLNAILINNTRLHFTIEDSYLHNAVCGVFLYNVENGTVENVTTSSDSVGVQLSYSDWCVVRENNCSGDGIAAYLSDNVTIEGNNCSWGGYIAASGMSILIQNNTCSHNSGITVSGMFTTNVTVIDNVCTFDSYGITIMNAYGVSVLNNTCSDNSAYGIYSNNGNPLIRGNDCSRCGFGIGVFTGSASVYENDCDYATTAGINWAGLGGTIVRNNCSHSITGIDATVIVNGKINISNNICIGNSGTGINLTGESLASAGGTVGNNTCVGSGMSGIHLTHFAGNVLNNTCTFNGYDGILFQHVGLSTIAMNNCSNNNKHGMWFSYTYNFMDGYRYSTYNTVVSNVVTGNFLGGILNDQTDHHTLTGNLLSGNRKIGIILSGSTYTTMRSQQMIGEGIFIQGSPIQVWALNDIDSSNLVNGKPVYYLANGVGGTVPGGQGQVILANCRDMTVEGQGLYNATVGLSLGFCARINVTGTYCSGGFHGMYIISSNGCWINGNEMRNNSMYGVYLGSGSGNVIWGNNFFGNRGAGSVYDPLRIQAYDGGTGNRWNGTSSGNWWNDWQTPDSNSDGIVDVPYVIAGGSQDNYPLTNPVLIPEFGSAVVVTIAAFCLVLAIAAVRRRNA